MWTLTMAVKLSGKLWLPIGAFTSGMMSTVSPGWTASQTSHSRSHGWNQSICKIPSHAGSQSQREILTPQMLLRLPRRQLKATGQKRKTY
ncbi:hypothetical protein B0H14DRAFT_3018246, partial [Mycena olivaceomarginata]